MTVLTPDPKVIAATQAEWFVAESNARMAFALMRLGTLDALHEGLTQADAFDFAYAIWDDFIDGRRAADVSVPRSADELREQATIFARCSPYLGPQDLLALASLAWGASTFEVYTRSLDSAITGKVGWYPSNSALNLRWSTGWDFTVWLEQGRLKRDLIKRRPGIPALHPLFGVAGS